VHFVTSTGKGRRVHAKGVKGGAAGRRWQNRRGRGGRRGESRPRWAGRMHDSALDEPGEKRDQPKRRSLGQEP